MNTAKHAARYYRNQTTHAAALAAHQRRHPSATLRDYRNRPDWKHGQSLRVFRSDLLTSQGPDMSAPDYDGPALLWLDPDAATVAECTPDRNSRPVYPLDHTGWYTTPDGWTGETLRAIAIILPEFPKLVFPAIHDTSGDSWRVMLDEGEPINFDGCESDYDADNAREEALAATVRAYDSTAEREAEQERRYQERDQLRRERDENRETRQGLRDDLRDLITEARDHCDNLPPAIAQATRDAIARTRAELDELARRNQEIADAIAD